jgi:glycosyltransferase involved in cell wall biosynthesis
VLAESRPVALFVAPSAYLLGGLAVWLDYVLPGLRDRGWDAVLGLVEGARHHRAQDYLRIHPDPRNVRIPCRTGTAVGRREALRRVYRDCQPDLVVSVNVPDAISAAAEMPSSDRPKTLVACHGIQADLFADMKALGRAVDGVACTNRLACRLAAQLGEVPEDRVHYAPCGTKSASVRAMPDRRAFTIAYVGRLEQEQKRVLDLVPVLRRMVEQQIDVRLIIAGNGPDERLLREQVTTYGLLDRVTFLGHVSSSEIPATVYEHADALLVTSLWETGPIVIWEAMAHCVPIVSSAYVGSGAEAALVDRRNALLFPVGDWEAASQLLIELHNSPELSASLRTHGLETFHNQYTLEKSITYWDTALRAVLAADRRGEQTFPMSSPRGRLSSFLSPSTAETVRRWAGRTGPDSGPGSEWPHAVSASSPPADDFFQLAASLDHPVQ